MVILTLSKNNPIESAKEAAFKEDVRTFQDALAMYIAKDYTAKAGQRDYKINATSLEDIQKYISSFSKKYEGKFVITNDELVYQEDSLTENELKWVNALNIKVEVNPVRKEWRTYIADEVDGVPIPKGFTHVVGTTKATGVVIEDSNHNEFVWIPSTESEYVKDTTFSGTTSTGEDTILSGLDETLDVKKYGGFYIGRYEATTPDGTESTKTNTTGVPTCKSGKTVWTNIDYTNSKTSAESMYTGENTSVKSGLLTGKAWDRACHFIEDYITTINTNSTLRDSRYYGNYSNSQPPANTGNYTSNQKQLSGANDNWKTKNIYDLAGNVWEWTYEAGSFDRVSRGGYYSFGGDAFPVSYRNYCSPSIANDNVGFRLRLYIKAN